LSKLFFITFSNGTGVIILVEDSSLLIHEMIIQWNEIVVTIPPQSKSKATRYGGAKTIRPLDEVGMGMESFYPRSCDWQGITVRGRSSLW
jgi:hypothetical protein